jgi:hypothetical protein
MAKFLILYRMSKGGVSHIDIQFPHAIGDGFENEHHMRSLISVIRIFYHIEGLRTILIKIIDLLVSRFQLGKLFVCMQRGQSSCICQLRDLQTTPGMAPNSDALEAIHGLLQLPMRSQNVTVTCVIHESLFLKGILMEAENPASATNESNESILSVLGIGLKSPQDELDGYLAPFAKPREIPSKIYANSAKYRVVHKCWP